MGGSVMSVAAAAAQASDPVARALAVGALAVGLLNLLLAYRNGERKRKAKGLNDVAADLATLRDGLAAVEAGVMPTDGLWTTHYDVAYDGVQSAAGRVGDRKLRRLLGQAGSWFAATRDVSPAGERDARADRVEHDGASPGSASRSVAAALARIDVLRRRSAD